MRRITQVRKRDGRVVAFDLRRVADAIYRAAQSVGGEDRFLAEELAGVVALWLEERHAGRIPGVEEVEEAVEKVLVETGHARTAKAFILRRDRRAAARQRVLVEEEPGERPLPLVGSDASGGVAAWSKARIAAALVEEGGLDPATADDVARAVEERVLSSGLPRVSSALVRALVDAELFARGEVRSLERQRVVGLPKHDLAALVDRGPPDRRLEDPGGLAEAIGEEVLRRYVLEARVPPAAAEAHRLGELHLEDLGSPFAVPVVSLSIEGLLSRHLRGEGSPRGQGPRRFAAALAEAVTRLGGAAARRFVLEDLNVFWAPFVDRLDEDALLLEARELLLSPAFQFFPRRGGLLRLEVVLAAEVPARLTMRPAPSPAPPGVLLGDRADAALRAARALLEAATGLRREGAGDRLPDLTLVVPRRGPRDPAARGLLSAALAAAAEAGEPVFVLDSTGLPSRGGRALRVGPDLHPDPFRHEQGDVSLVSVCAVNLVGPALRAGAGHVEAYLDEVDRLATLAVLAAEARRGGLLQRADAPDGGLWTLRRGVVPLLDVESGFHRIDAVGAERAAALVGGHLARAGQEALSERILARLAARVGEEAARRDLAAYVAEAGPGEAATRFAATDAARYETARGWWGEETDPTYAASRPTGDGAFREPCAARRPGRSGGFERHRRRLDSGRRPAIDVLVADFEAAAADLSVAEYALDPWPRRILRAAP